MARLRVLLVDDHALVRAGIRSLLQELPDVEVVAEASDGAQALQIAEREQPDVVLMDIAMKGMNGLEAAARLRERSAWKSAWRSPAAPCRSIPRPARARWWLPRFRWGRVE